MAIIVSFVHCLPNILHSLHGYTTAFRWYDCQWPWAYFKVIGLFHIKFLKNGVWYGKSYYRLLIGNRTLAFDWCHFWWPWSTFEGHFSQGCYFHVHFSNPWHAIASHDLPAIAELLVSGADIGCEVTVDRESDGSLSYPQLTSVWGSVLSSLSGVWGAELQPQTIFGRFMRHFVRFHVCFSALWVGKLAVTR